MTMTSMTLDELMAIPDEEIEREIKQVKAMPLIAATDDDTVAPPTNLKYHRVHPKTKIG